MTETTTSVLIPNNHYNDSWSRNNRLPKLLPFPGFNLEEEPVNTIQPSFGSNKLVYIFVPVGCILIVIFLLTAYRRLYSTKQSLRANSNQSSAFDPERGLDDNSSTPPSKLENRNSEMQIVSDGGGKLDVAQQKPKDNREDECVDQASVQVVSLPPSTLRRSCSENETENGDLAVKEQLVERPSTLKLLAASAAFQKSTVPAVKRDPQTPDPDSTLQSAIVEPPCAKLPAESELKDIVTPLHQPPRRMKPRGLLERRGSNVTLTISLKSGEENNSSNPPTIAASKSPKPTAQLRGASCPLTVDELHQKSCDTGALQKEFWGIPMNHPAEKNFNIPGHGTKNRHRILPNDHSRVKLPCNPGEDQLSSYINANYIRDCGDLPTPNTALDDDDSESTPVTRNEAAFIATQGPLTNTVDDFWRMIWQERISSVVMLTKLKERKEKCVQYFPIGVGAEETYNQITVRVTNVNKHEHFSIRTMEISNGGESRTLCHFWHATWMDHETPEKTRGLLEMVQEVSMWDKSSHGPIVVHCSAGIGRTGCYIATYVGCQQLMRAGKTDILRIVSQMRLDRGGMIQTWEQYQFVHLALSRYGRVLAGENVTTPSTAGSIRSPHDCALKSSCPKEAEELRPRTPKHRRSTSDVNLPTPKELKASSTKSAVESRLKRENSNKGHQTSLSVTIPPCRPLVCPSPNIVSPKLAESPTIRSPFNRMCLQTKDLNAGNSPFSSFKFKWPTIAVDDKVSAAAEVRNGSKKSSPGRLRFSFTTVTLSSNSPNGNRSYPLSAGKSPSKSRFSFDLPSPRPKTPLTNGHFARSPRSNISARSASPRSGGNHFVFPSPGTL